MLRLRAISTVNRLLLAIGLLLALALLTAGCQTDSGPVGVVYPDGSRRVTPEQAKPLVDRGKAVLVDTRSSDQFKQAHPVGAVSAPILEISDRTAHPLLAGLAADKELILYCT